MTVVTLESLYTAHRRSLLALCKNIIGSDRDAEDALHEVFIAAWEALPSFRNESSHRTWLHRIAIRVALKVKARIPTVSEMPDQPGADPAEVHARNDALRRALARLSAEQCTLLSLFAVEGFTHAEIAEILMIPEGTVWSRVHTARTQLIELMRSEAVTERSHLREAWFGTQ